ncbi:MAG: response regulator [Planctomycetes bacterium]|nr:response regulator [Planctomycetota bacterium]
MPVVRRIVEGCAGAVEVESVLGEGTTFRVYLPVVLGEATPSGTVKSLLRIGTGQRVLCVDDEEGITRLQQSLLSALGFEPRVLNDSRLALEVLRTAPKTYDLAMFDVRMPGMNGVELARAAARFCPDLRILLLTAEGTGTGEEEKLLEEGVISAILRKPATGADLGLAVAEALGLDIPTS